MDVLTQQATVTLLIEDPTQGQCYTLCVPGSTEEEGWRFLENLSPGSAAVGVGGRQWLAGATWTPIRQRYEAMDQALARAAESRLGALGSKPTLAQLEALVRDATASRTRSARLWRLPTGPDVALLAEARDWRKYGPGGRSFDNLLGRSMKNSERMTWSRGDHLRQMLRNVDKTNPKVTAGVLRNARFLRGGGSVLFIAGLGWTAYEYQQTPVAQRAEFLKREGVSMLGGAVATGLAVALVISAPVSGVVVFGVALVAGVAGSTLAEGVYRSMQGGALMEQIRVRGVIDSGVLQK